MKHALRSSVNLIPLRIRGWIKHVPILRRLQRAIVENILAGEPFGHVINVGPAKGLRFEITLPQDKAFWSGTFETDFMDALAANVIPGDVCYDIGAHRGYVTGVFALAGAQQVVAFEPLPGNVAAIHKLLQMNGFQRTVRLEQFALGGSDGQAQFKIMPDQSMGKLTESPFQPGAPAVREIDVNVRRLDSLVFDIGLPPPDVIKIDVEGAEEDVLAGAAKTISAFRPRLFIEAHSSDLANACTKRLTELKYQVRQLEPKLIRAEQARHLVALPESKQS